MIYIPVDNYGYIYPIPQNMFGMHIGIDSEVYVFFYLFCSKMLLGV